MYSDTTSNASSRKECSGEGRGVLLPSLSILPLFKEDMRDSKGKCTGVKRRTVVIFILDY